METKAFDLGQMGVCLLPEWYALRPYDFYPSIRMMRTRIRREASTIAVEEVQRRLEEKTESGMFVRIAFFDSNKIRVL